MKSMCAIFLLSASTAVFAAPLTENPQLQAKGIPARYDGSYSKATQIRGIDAPSGELLSSVATLKDQAAAGNAQAAAQLAAGLAECKGVWGKPNDSVFEAHCVGLTDADIAEAGKWLATAAALGDPEAQYGYATAGFDDIIGVQEAEKNPAAFAAFKQNAKTYLIDLATQCNIDAIGAIASSASRNGLVFGDDPATGYKFLLVEEAIANSIAHAADSLATQQVQLEKKVNPQSIPEIRASADVFVNQYCK